MGSGTRDEIVGQRDHASSRGCTLREVNCAALAEYFGSSLVVLLFVLSIATYGFIVSLAGQPAFGVRRQLRVH